jgi:cytidine deaminase
MSIEVDWHRLRAAAVASARNAYAPYSHLRVGAAALTDQGRLLSACNVENASYGLTLCAECGLVCSLHSSGGGLLVAVSVVAGDGQLLLPCGRCRQLLLEAGGGDLMVDADPRPTRLAELLPAGFSADDVWLHRDT